MSKDIICIKCQAINSTNIIEKNGQKTVWCANCGAYIKNLGYAEDKFYFGRYKGMKVADVNDRPYLKWFLDEKSIRKSPKMRSALQQQIEKLLL